MDYSSFNPLILVSCKNIIELSNNELFEMFQVEILSLDKFHYFYYNCEDIYDEGWGCAWRCIQMLLSCLIQDKTLSLSYEDYKFSSLFNKFRSRDSLLNIYNELNSSGDGKSLPDFLIKSKFAPSDNKNNWAEPFIAHLCLGYFGIKGKLFLVNGYPSANAPREVFEKIINFTEFKLFILDHFTKSKYPIMIDDSIYAYCIVGCSNVQDSFSIIIADPHVWSSKGEVWKDKIYKIDIDKNGYSGKHISFDKSNWMIYSIN